MSNPQLIAGVVFALAYILVISRVIRPVLVVLLAGIALVFTQTITLEQALQSINLNVLGIVWGTMVLAELFIASHATDYLAGQIVSRMRTVGLALVAVSAFAGFVSAFVDNVATVLIIAPVAFDIAHRLKVSPAPFLIGVAISSNLQGTATMIGDSTSIILATTADMSFLEFFWLNGRPSVFFAVEIAAVAATFLLYLLFRNMQQRIEFENQVKVLTWTPTWLLAALITSLASSSFIPGKPVYAVGLITVSFGVLGILWNATFDKLPFKLRNLDWETLLFLTGIFVLVGSLSATGIVERLAAAITAATGGSTLTAFLVLVWLSVIVSAFVDNIPYTIAMLPVAQQVAASLGVSPFLLMFGLLIGTSLGGNVTPIGASANVVAVGMLRKHGINVSFADFAKIGLPFTLVAVITASIFVWLFWS